MLRGDLADELGRRVAAAVEAACSVEIGVEEAAIRPAPPERPADYQSKAAMPLAKRLSLPSRQVAAGIAEHFEAGDMVEPPEVSGPGFVNFTLRREWLERHMRDSSTDDRLGVAREESPSKVVVDYSSPNAAKEMHAGHLRSTILGDAIVRLLRFAGHEVIPQNHLGDWGTPFGMLVEELIERGRDGSVQSEVRDLNAFYQAVRARFDSDPEFAERARRRVVALQSGDPQTVAVWRELIRES